MRIQRLAFVELLALARAGLPVGVNNSVFNHYYNSQFSHSRSHLSQARSQDFHKGEILATPTFNQPHAY